eukprot:CAMPEP_0202354966 /NCGR_PEP_ID=MMETSP1126-20121109/10057_1 /ASSEMBLY_ACC=CAM_ASM_000457 /TAXON_ID=3047 /ORGANISM="Dunaliella tertiolecta, Strain CCMP1320" /LENGTH=67 /DNA_ID=CAMNT_0048947503 /DNA_START=58 /DNA_END=261 /DNA_ORIENTATION=+
MSATIDKRLVTEQHLLDIIDDEWLKDTLPDDLVPLPEGLEAAPEGLDEEKLSKGIQGKPERWNEPGL